MTAGAIYANVLAALRDEIGDVPGVFGEISPLEGEISPLPAPRRDSRLPYPPNWSRRDPNTWDWITTEEARRRLGVGRRQLRRLVATDKILGSTPAGKKRPTRIEAGSLALYAEHRYRARDWERPA